MFTLISHCLYATVAYYSLKAFETYQAQLSVGISKKDAVKNALLWPKYLVK